jgi:hypothetical protein
VPTGDLVPRILDLLRGIDERLDVSSHSPLRTLIEATAIRMQQEADRRTQDLLERFSIGPDPAPGADLRPEQREVLRRLLPREEILNLGSRLIMPREYTRDFRNPCGEILLGAHSSGETQTISEPGLWAREHMGSWEREPVGFTMHEMVGVAAFNPRAMTRITVPAFELHSNPTVQLDDIRNRRFGGFMNRTFTEDHPLITALLKQREAQRKESEEDAWVAREQEDLRVLYSPAPKTIWERLLSEEPHT